MNTYKIELEPDTDTWIRAGKYFVHVKYESDGTVSAKIWRGDPNDLAPVSQARAFREYE